MSAFIAVSFLSMALLSTAFGHLFYKLYFLRKKFLYVVLAIALFCLAPFFSYFALVVLDIGVVYMSTALVQIIVLAFSRTVLGERITRDHIFGSILIVFGTVVYNL